MKVVTPKWDWCRRQALALGPKRLAGRLDACHMSFRRPGGRSERELVGDVRFGPGLSRFSVGSVAGATHLLAA